jgi:hypothetical protein
MAAQKDDRMDDTGLEEAALTHGVAGGLREDGSSM